MTERLELEIELNRISQGYVSQTEGLRWFRGFDESSQRDILRILVYLVLQARVTPDDIANAIQQSSLKPTSTPCIMVSRGALNVQLAKAVQLPKEELGKLFELLIFMLRFADSRRKLKCGSDCKHWWHAKLDDSRVIEEIKKRYNEGNL